MGVLVLVLPLVLLASAFAGVVQNDVCGKQELNADATGRAAGASDTVYGEFPWMAALHYKYKSNGLDAGIRCGGYVINERFVLTAAHCLHLAGVKLDKVWLGVRRISEAGTKDVDKVRKFDVDTEIPHERYDAIKEVNDIALLKLKGSITFSLYIRKVCLPDANAQLPESGTMLTVSGWGAIRSNSEEISDLKLKVDVPMYTHDICQQKGVLVHAEQFCAEGENLKGTCWGDGGGPLMQNIPTSIERQWFAIGLVSGLSGCGAPGKPIVHTRVSSYIDWIKQNTLRP